MKILVIGKGFIGSRCAVAWEGEALLATGRIETLDDARRLLNEHRPDAVLNAAGVRGKPNVDWCETHPLETMLGNTVMPALLAAACQETGTYLLHVGSGCVFYGASPDPKGWKEYDHANPVAVYSKCKYAADLALSTLPHTGIARIRMPIDSISSPTNLIDKLASFAKVADVENSATIIEDMITVFHRLIELRAEGIFHATNPGTITHRRIMELYRHFVDPAHTNEWIAEDDMVREGLVAKKRSNNFLQSERLTKLGIAMRPIDEALQATMQHYARAKNA